MPLEYTLFDLDERREPLFVNAHTSARGGSRSAYRIFPATKPASREEVHQLAVTLEAQLKEAGTRTDAVLDAWDETFEELVRQVFVECNDRGALLGRVRRSLRHYVDALLKRVATLESSARETLVQQLQAEVEALAQDSTDAKADATRNRVLSRMRGGVRMSMAVSDAQKKLQHLEGADHQLVSFLGYLARATPAERDAVWSTRPSIAA
jgi:transcriptional regulator of heat shock response